jgi:O-antigen ligase
MPLNLKDLIVVLVISSVVFKIGKSTALLFSAEKDFLRRRNVWYFLTIISFLTPNIWLYALAAVPILLITGRRDSNPSALYLFLLNAIPPVYTAIPLPGNTTFIDLTNRVLLILCVIVPAIGVLRRKDRASSSRGLYLVDYCLIAYGVLTSIFYIHVLAPNGTFFQSSFTDFLRRMLTFSIAVLTPYLFISRGSQSRRMIIDNAAAFLLPCVVMAVIAVFESTRGWLLYEVIPQRWGLAASFSSYLLRGSSLRGMASTAHSLSLGYNLAIAFGIWLSLGAYVKSRVTRLSVTATLGLGLIATYSRGPWACAALIYVIFVALKPGPRSALIKSAFASAAVLAVISASPYGRRIAAALPFLGGKLDTSTIDYRGRLWDRGWSIIQQHPLLGDQFAVAKMQDLRQGQGIIDFVNGYVSQLLATGFIGLSLFLSVVIPALFKVLSASRAINSVDQRFGALGLSLVCSIIGTLFLWAFGGPDPDVLWALVAMSLAYSHIGSSPGGIEHLLIATDAQWRPPHDLRV